MEPLTRHSLVLRLRNPDDELAWTEFVQLYEPLIIQLIKKQGLQESDAHDVCQEVFRAVTSAIERWDPDPAKGSFRGWLFRIARNLLVKSIVQQRRQLRGSGSTSVQELLEAKPTNDQCAEEEFATEFRRRAFRWAAEQVKCEFSDSTWLAFWKTGVENQPIAQAAQDLGLSTGAIYIARTRVLARLRERVEQLTEDTGLHDGESHD